MISPYSKICFFYTIAACFVYASIFAPAFQESLKFGSIASAIGRYRALDYLAP
jgi:hypothetical protein